MNGLSIFINIPASILGLKKGMKSHTLKDSPIGWGVFELPTRDFSYEL